MEGEQTRAVEVQRSTMGESDFRDLLDEQTVTVIDGVTQGLNEQTSAVEDSVDSAADRVTDAVVEKFTPVLDERLAAVKAAGEEVTTSYVMLPDEQWAGVVDAGRLCCSCAVICTVMLAALCGLVAFRILVQGWRR